MEAEIVVKSMKPCYIYSLVSQLRRFIGQVAAHFQVWSDHKKKNYITLSFYQKTNYQKYVQWL